MSGGSALEGTMSQGLVDRILEISESERIRALKNLSYREGFLRDHFPGFPLMPGALQLETMIQAAQWLLRASLGFPAADFLPTRVRNTRYARFVRPGDRLEVDVSLVSRDGPTFRFKGVGSVDGERSIVSQFDLEWFDETWKRSLGEDEAQERFLQGLRLQYERLRQPALPRFEHIEETP